MRLDPLFVSARSASFALDDGGLYHTKRPYRLLLNGRDAGLAQTCVFSLFGLSPDTRYTLEVMDGAQPLAEAAFHTEREDYTLNVRRFGALGDGVHDDTAAIQAAILCCPPRSRVYLPRGDYRVGPLFLKSHLRLEIAAGARLCLIPERERLPILPGTTERADEQGELCLGTWEGNPLDMFAALLTGVDVEDVQLYGPGIVDGCAQQGDWWKDPKVRRGAWRGRLLFLCRCRDVTVQGLTFQNSPSWHVHPYFSERLRFINIAVGAPGDSPNTDGFDPESCREVRVAGARFSVGDDCIAVKSGKLYMGSRYRTPCEDVDISHCLMENGHGGVTIGSEMSGGVRSVTVRDCLMRSTDRGLRIKTRRGRGEQGVIDGIALVNVRMERVRIPFTVNCLYACDPDGHSPYVQSRAPLPVDARTPRVGSLRFARVRAVGCGACAAYLLGLPELPIESVALEDVSFAFDPQALPLAPVMADGVEPCLRRGLIAQNVGRLSLCGVRMAGQMGATLEMERVSQVEGSVETQVQ